MTYFAVTDTDRAAGRATELGGAVGAPPFDTAFGRVAVLSDPARGQVAAQGDRTGPGGGRNSGVGPGVRCPLAGSSSSWTWG
jgi:predicted enzyme related to lactoylglutathione lyase